MCSICEPSNMVFQTHEATRAVYFEIIIRRAEVYRNLREMNRILLESLVKRLKSTRKTHRTLIFEASREKDEINRATEGIRCRNRGNLRICQLRKPYLPAQVMLSPFICLVFFFFFFILKNRLLRA